MPNVHGIDFNSNQSELVKDLIRELLKDEDCVVYSVSNMKPNGELRIASQPPTASPRRIGGGVFFRVKPGVHEATVIRPMNAKAGEQYMKVTKLSQADLLAIVRIWRKQTKSSPTQHKSVVAEVEKQQLVTV